MGKKGIIFAPRIFETVAVGRVGLAQDLAEAVVGELVQDGAVGLDELPDRAEVIAQVPIDFAVGVASK